MNSMSGSTLENIYFGIMLIVAALLAWSGWRQGVVRQAMTLLAIAAAYAVGWFGRKAVAPLFGFLGYPVQLTEIIGGVAAGLVAFIAVKALSKFLFKRTAEKAAGRVRTSYGIFGAVLGVVFAGLLFIVASDVIRLLGAIAKSNVEAQVLESREFAANQGVMTEPGPQPGGVLRGLAELATALDDGGSREVLDRVDPVPANVYATVIKLGIMVSRPEAVDRFRRYPGVATLTEHPKLHALFADVEVGRLIESGSYLKLLRNEKVVALANDREFSEQVKQMDLDAALKFALTPQPPQKPPQR